MCSKHGVGTVRTERLISTRGGEYCERTVEEKKEEMVREREDFEDIEEREEGY